MVLRNHCCSNSFKLGCILTMTFLYFIAELVVGIIINSVALLADSFHMLSDVLSIIIGIIAIRASTLPKSKANTFGWQRAEVFGSLINSISLLTLCFTILLKAVENIIEPKGVKEPMLMLIVGGGGMLMNFIGMVILNPFSHHGHGHSHGGHSHGGHNHNGNRELKVPNLKPSETNSHNKSGVSNDLSKGENVTRKDTIEDSDNDEEEDAVKLYTSMKKTSMAISNVNEVLSEKEPRNMNVKGVMLHVMADLFGSVVVVATALVLLYCPEKKFWGVNYKLYVDPLLSVIMVGIILVPTFSLLKQSSLILLQSVPEEINIRRLNAELDEIETVQNIHDLHVWHLRPGVIIGTVHVKVNSIDDYSLGVREMKNIFHNFNIHCTTIQPEFNMVKALSVKSISDRSDKCEILCSNTLALSCSSDKCCPGEK